MSDVDTEMLERWRQNPHDTVAAAATLKLIRELASHLRFPATVTEEAAGMVIEEILAKVHARTLPPVQNARAFLRKRLCWRCLDVIEDSKPPPPPPPGKTPPPIRTCPFDNAEEIDLLHRAFRMAKRSRDEQHQPHIQAAWERCEQWHSGTQTMTEIVAAECAAKGITDPKAIRTVYDRETRAQARLREAMRDAVDVLEQTQKLDANAAALTLALIDRLERCPKGSLPRVPGAS